ncbi:hypothetical protein [Rossellomorea marisflavi]|uniref:hypothetical protein n=1 Tax=Rossellomorea marisflavi TaxID=189381 RepID=UPI0011E6E2C1|nr:hypothetical protein [Rossellomorea marisflavi]TYO68602.1 hypothetical protein DQ398_003768 [Rossellomorea marisflavi]
MKKKIIKLAIVSMVLGSGGGLLYNQFNGAKEVSASTTKVQEGESFELIQTSNDKELYKEFDSNIKLPKKVEFNRESVGKASFNKSQSFSGEKKINSLEKENKAESYIETDIREYVKVKEYIHQYYDNDKRENITFQVFNDKINLDLGEDKELGLVTTKEVYLNNGIKAIFADGEDRNLLHFYDKASDLTYILVGTKEIGEFTENELLEIANSMY